MCNHKIICERIHGSWYWEAVPKSVAISQFWLESENVCYGFSDNEVDLIENERSVTLCLHFLTHAGSEVLTPVVMSSSVFWVITSCSPLKDNRRLGGTFRLHLHGRRLSQETKQQQSASFWCLGWLTIQPWKERRYFSPKYLLTFTTLHLVISQKIKYSVKETASTFMLDLLFSPEDRGGMFLRNIGWLDQIARHLITGDRTLVG
jgi:hypothetical protein